MYKSFLIKYGEIAIKGKNRYLFEEALVCQIRYALKEAEGEFHVRRLQGRIYVDAAGEYDYDEVMQALSHVFGIVGICPVVLLKDEGFERLAEDVIAYMDKVYPDKHLTFKVHARRARKNYPMDSMELNAALGILTRSLRDPQLFVLHAHWYTAARENRLHPRQHRALPSYNRLPGCRFHRCGLRSTLPAQTGALVL